MEKISRIELRLINPKEAGEEWTEYYDVPPDVVEILIDGISLMDMIAEREYPLKKAEGWEDECLVTSGYGHMFPWDFYGWTNLFMPCTVFWCGECHEETCWPLELAIDMDEENVYWHDFRQPHRPEWKYDLSFVFDINQYRAEMMKLEELLKVEPNKNVIPVI